MRNTSKVVKMSLKLAILICLQDWPKIRSLFLTITNCTHCKVTCAKNASFGFAWLIWVFFCRYAAILFKKQRYVSSQHRMNIKIVCKDNFKYEVQERAASNAISLQQLAEEYWRIDKFFLISFPILFFIFNIIYWLAFILWTKHVFVILPLLLMSVTSMIEPQRNQKSRNI